MLNEYTDAKARLKLCHMTMNTPNSEYRYCHGSNCMAWRWSEHEVAVEQKGGNYDMMPCGHCGAAEGTR